MAVAGPANHFDRNESQVIYGTGTQARKLALLFQLSYSLLELVHARRGEF
jgi:hypothetical protein